MDEELNFQLILVSNAYFKMFRIQGRSYQLVIDSVPDGTPYLTAYSMVHDVIERKCYFYFIRNISLQLF